MQMNYRQRTLAHEATQLMGSSASDVQSMARKVSGVRRQLESIRLVCEMIKKREKLKREWVCFNLAKTKSYHKTCAQVMSCQRLTSQLCRSVNDAMMECVEELKNKDRHYEIFHHAITDEVRLPKEKSVTQILLQSVPGYSTIVKEPMDLTTMQAKVQSNDYRSFAAFQSDFDLMIKNCLKFNHNNPFYFKAGQRMKRMVNHYCSSLI